MRTAFFIAVVALCAVRTLAQLTNVISTSSLSGTKYEFTLSFDELDRGPSWPATAECPPLSPRKAVVAGREFLGKLTGNKIDWRLSTITLHKYTEGGDPSRDKWAYKVRFLDAGVSNGPVRSFEVVVYMTGKVIEPHVSRGKS